MASVSDLLERTRSIATQIAGITEKVRDHTLRPSYRQATQLQEAAAVVLQSAQTLLEQLTSCETVWTETVRQMSDTHISQARLAVQAMIQGHIKPSIFQRNLKVIFQEQQVSANNSSKVQGKKARARQKCLKLRSLKAGVIVQWSVSFPPNKWESMRQDVFDDVVEGMKKEPLGSLPLYVREILLTLEGQEPLRGVAAYHSFVRDIDEIVTVEQLATNPPDHCSSERRRLDVDGIGEEERGSDRTAHSEGESERRNAAAHALPWVGNEPQGNEIRHVSFAHLRFNVPEEKAMNLLNLRSGGLEDVWRLIILTIPVDWNSPASVFFNVPRQAALQYAKEDGLEVSWLHPIAY